MIAAIVAVNKDWGIGYNNELLEHIPADLKRFKKLTTGKLVVMGSKTWHSLPNKPLPNRYNYVITSKSSDYPEPQEKLAFGSMEQMIEFLDNYDEKFNGDVFIIGGESIYKQLLPYCDSVYVTKINKSHENVDTYFPNLNKMEDWACYEPTEWMEHNGTQYRFEFYSRH